MTTTFRAELFAFLDEQRKLAMKEGFLEVAKLHAMNARRLADDLALFD
ncbi:hypothetical protein [Sinorhizobium psoraleae]|uniref:Uncharacterized protein n=1 Tax=Sinorhizobium psoraleae TaxID=520838 RepID=A0ABT4KB23_9HYPH|nr:hypothetical protein [Sinorhizobium psoraleae]MCZ4089102.1 hypothetical protein [Sinorhizobium psoraleae]